MDQLGKHRMKPNEFLHFPHSEAPQVVSDCLLGVHNVGLMRAMDALGELTYIERPQTTESLCFKDFQSVFTLRSTSQKAAIITATSTLLKTNIYFLKSPF